MISMFVYQFCFTSILGAFATLRKATVSLIMSVCLSVQIEQLGYHCTDCHEIRFFNILKKFKFYKNLKITGTLRKDVLAFMIISSLNSS
jgi:hypothetical protein